MATTAVPRNLYTGGTSAVLYTDQRKFYLDENMVKELYPDVTPFITLLSNRKQKTGLTDPVFKLFQHTNPWERQYMRVNGDDDVSIGAASTGASTESAAIDFDGITGLPSSIDTSFYGLVFEVWDTTLTTKRGTCMLTDSDSASTADFKNLTGTAIATDDDDYFICIGNAQEEGIVSPDAWADTLTVVWNQCQIFRTPLEITGTLKQAILRGESKELARLRVQKLGEHKIQKEHAFLKSQAPLGTNLGAADTFTDLDKLTGWNDKVARTTYGIIPAIETYGASSGASQANFTITEAAYKYADFVDDMEKVFQYVPNTGEKYAFAGPGMMSYWSKLDGTSGWAGKSAWKVNIGRSERDTMGFNIRKLETPHGVINLVKTHTLKYEYNKFMVIVDDRNLEMVTYRPSEFRANIKTDNAYDGIKDEYFSDQGIGLTNIKSHQLFHLA